MNQPTIPQMLQWMDNAWNDQSDQPTATMRAAIKVILKRYQRVSAFDAPSTTEILTNYFRTIDPKGWERAEKGVNNDD